MEKEYIAKEMLVTAREITEIVQENSDGTVGVKLADGEVFIVTAAMTETYYDEGEFIGSGDLVVNYPCNTVKVMPRRVFNSQYTLKDPA